MEIKIFSPAEVFKDKLETSWCGNIRTDKDSFHVPVIRDGFEGKPSLNLIPDYPGSEDNIDASKYYVIALPLNRSWSPVDLHSNFDRLVLSFAMDVSNPDTCMIDVGFSSLVNDVEKDSNKINLLSSIKKEQGWQRVNVPMIAFRVKNNQFETSCVRLFKFVCTGWSPIQLADIRVIESNFLGSN